MKKYNLVSLVTALALFSLAGCSKSEEDAEGTLKAEGYVIGYHPCVANSIVTTPKGRGNGYLIETSKKDTVMVYGVPSGMFDIPMEWFTHSKGYLLPEEGRRKFKIEFTYKLSSGKSMGGQYPCNTMGPPPSYKNLQPEYYVLKAKRIK
jgi:hypothetical protein